MAFLDRITSTAPISGNHSFSAYTSPLLGSPKDSRVVEERRVRVMESYGEGLSRLGGETVSTAFSR